MTGEEDQGRAFKVQDRRRFSETGDARPDADDAGDNQQAAPRPDQTADQAQTEEPHAHDEAAEKQAHNHQYKVPELNFAGFVVSLSTQALAHLGEIPDPVEGVVRADLNAARQMIDILAILREKTKGNLDSAENALLEGALYDLRMKYVEKARR